jgi:hypothetical protein
MNNPSLSDKDYVSVLPRIIDPKMQFTKESIENTFESKNVDIVCKNDNKLKNKEGSNNIQLTNKIEEVPVATASFFSEYKYVILIIVIVIITIAIIYFIYKYYSNKKEKEKELNKAIENTEVCKNEEEIKQNKEKTENIKAYISNYIINEDEDEDEDEEVHAVQEDEEVHSVQEVHAVQQVHAVQEDEEVHAVQQVHEVNKIKEVQEVNKIKEVQEVREYNNNIINKPIIINTQNIDIPHVDNIIDSLLLHKEYTKEENYDSLLNDIDSDTQSNISYDNTDNNKDNINTYENVFNSDVIKYESENENESKSENIIEVRNKNEVIDMDDIKYFQKFSKLT